MIFVSVQGVRLLTRLAFFFVALLSSASSLLATGSFSLSAAPGSQTAWQGNTTSFAVTVTSTDGFSDPVSFNTSGLPGGINARFSPASINGPGTTTLTLAVSPGTATGNYTFSVNAASPTVTQSTAVALIVVVPPPIRYTYDALGRLTSVTDQTSASAVYNYDAVGNVLSIARQNVSQLGLLTASPSHGLPGSTFILMGSGFDSIAANNSVLLGGATATVVSAAPTQLVVTVPAQATTGAITVSNSEGSTTSPFQFTVDTPTTGQIPDFNLTSNSTALNLIAGSSATYVINTNALSGFTGSVNFSISSLPAGVSGSFDSNTVTTPGTAVLAITTATSIQTGQYTLQVVGTSGTLTHTIFVPITVIGVASDFQLSSSQPMQTVVAGLNASYVVSVGFNSQTQGPVSLSLANVPPDALATLSSSSLTQSGTSTITVTVGPQTASNAYQITLIARTGSITHTLKLPLLVADAKLLNASWLDQDIGGSAPGTGASYSNGAFTVAGTGMLWGNADQFHYTYQTLTGDGTIIARLVSQQNVGGTAKAGLMMRDSLSPAAMNVMVDEQAGGFGPNFQWRSATGSGYSAEYQSPSNTPIMLPCWFMLVRSGNNFSGYTSADGLRWTQQGPTVNIPMGNTIYMGLGVTAENGNQVTTATFDNVINSARPNFAVSPSGQTVLLNKAIGSVGAVQLNQISTPEFSDTVSYSVRGLPSGITVSFSSNTITGPGTNMVTFTVNTSIAPGSYALAITGTDATTGTVQTVPVSLVISATSMPPATGLQLWLKADSITGVADQASISAWPDSSPNPGAVNAPSGSVNFATNAINGFPAVAFAGGFLTIQGGLPVSTQYSAFVVMKNTSLGSKGTIFSGSNGGSFNYWTQGNGKQQGFDVAGWTQVGYGTQASDTNWHQMSISFDSSAGALNFRLDGSPDATLGFNNRAPANPINRIGANFDGGYLNGEIAELLIYSRVLNASEITAIESYLNQKYNL